MRIVNGINENKTASGFIVSAYEPIFDKIHYLRSDTKSRTLIIFGDTQSSYKYCRIGPSLFFMGNHFMQMPFRVIGQVSRLNGRVGKCNHGDNLSIVAIIKPTICLAHQISLIGDCIIYEKIV